MNKKLFLLLEKFEKEKKKLSSIKVFRKGSISKRWMSCGNSLCKCKTDKKFRHGPYYWWTTKESGKTKAILIPENFLTEGRSYINNNKIFQKQILVLSKLADQIVRINIKILKKEIKLKLKN